MYAIRSYYSSSNINKVDSCLSLAKNEASLMRWLSPPLRVLLAWPSLMYPRPTSASGCKRFNMRFSVDFGVSAKNCSRITSYNVCYTKLLRTF